MDRPPEASDENWRAPSDGSNRTVAQRTSMQDRRSPLAGSRPPRKSFQSSAPQQPRSLASNQRLPVSSTGSHHDSESVSAKENVANEKAAAQWRIYRESMSPKASERLPSEASQTNDEQDGPQTRKEEGHNTVTEESLDDNEDSPMPVDDTWDTSSIEDDGSPLDSTRMIHQDWDISNNDWDDALTADTPQSDDHLQRPPSPMKASYTARDQVQPAAAYQQEAESDSWKHDQDTQPQTDFFWGQPPEKDPLPANIDWGQSDPVHLPGDVDTKDTVSDGWKMPLPDETPSQTNEEEDQNEEKQASATISDGHSSQESLVEDGGHRKPTQKQDTKVTSSEISSGGWDTGGVSWDPPSKKTKSKQKQKISKLDTPEPSASVTFTPECSRFEFKFDDPEYTAISSTDYSIVYHCPTAAISTAGEGSSQSSASPVPSNSPTSPAVGNTPQRSQWHTSQKESNSRGPSSKQTQMQRKITEVAAPQAKSPFFYPQFLSEPPPEFKTARPKPSKPKLSPTPPSK